jgi:hypothetical protein
MESPKIYHQRCTDVNCNPSHPFKTLPTCWIGAALRKMIPLCVLLTDDWVIRVRVQVPWWRCIQPSHKAKVALGSHKPSKVIPTQHWWQLQPSHTHSKCLLCIVAVLHLLKTKKQNWTVLMHHWFTYRSNATSNQATKPKLCRAHIIQQN